MEKGINILYYYNNDNNNNYNNDNNDNYYRRDFRLLVKGDDGKAFPHPVLWFNSSITSKYEVLYIRLIIY